MTGVSLIVGRRGAGKTTRARALALQARRCVVFDPMAEWASWAHFRPVRGWHELRRALAARWRGPFRLAYVPGPQDPARELHQVARLLYLAQASGPALLFCIDEAHVGYPAQQLPRECWGMRACVLQGRHRSIEVLAVAQRPALVSADLRGNAACVITFPLSHPDDQAAIERLIGRGHGIERLIDHHYLEWRAGQGVRKGRNQGRGATGRRPR